MWKEGYAASSVFLIVPPPFLYASTTHDGFKQISDMGRVRHLINDGSRNVLRLIRLLIFGRARNSFYFFVPCPHASQQLTPRRWRWMSYQWKKGDAWHAWACRHALQPRKYGVWMRRGWWRFDWLRIRNASQPVCACSIFFLQGPKCYFKGPDDRIAAFHQYPFHLRNPYPKVSAVRLGWQIERRKKERDSRALKVGPCVQEQLCRRGGKKSIIRSLLSEAD